jgi:hypothetical protein
MLKPTSNSLVYKTRKIIGDLQLEVKIKLDDECKNGHQDFSATATLYEKDQFGHLKATSSGCLHDEILTFFPEFKIFVDLHLCDYSGAPMHAVSNMFYQKSKDTFQKYYNCISDEDYQILSQAEDSAHFNYLLDSSQIPNKWLESANKAIILLQDLTKTDFINDSKRSNYVPLSQDKYQLIKKNIELGYYSPENIKEREQAKQKELKQDLIDKELAQYYKEVKNLQVKHKVNMLAINLFNTVNNIIVYTHTNSIEFNWSGNAYNKKYTLAEFEKFKSFALLDSFLESYTFKYNEI